MYFSQSNCQCFSLEVVPSASVAYKHGSTQLLKAVFQVFTAKMSHDLYSFLADEGRPTTDPKTGS